MLEGEGHSLGVGVYEGYSLVWKYILRFCTAQWDGIRQTSIMLVRQNLMNGSYFTFFLERNEVAFSGAKRSILCGLTFCLITTLILY